MMPLRAPAVQNDHAASRPAHGKYFGAFIKQRIEGAQSVIPIALSLLYFLGQRMSIA
jgi:hypothetical protein